MSVTLSRAEKTKITWTSNSIIIIIIIV